MSEVIESVSGETADRGPRSGILEGYLSDGELAAELGTTVATLRRYRRLGTGPAFTKVGRDVIYRISAVRAWLAGKEQKTQRRQRGG